MVSFLFPSILGPVSFWVFLNLFTVIDRRSSNFPWHFFLFHRRVGVDLFLPCNPSLLLSFSPVTELILYLLSLATVEASLCSKCTFLCYLVRRCVASRVWSWGLLYFMCSKINFCSSPRKTPTWTRYFCILGRLFNELLSVRLSHLSRCGGYLGIYQVSRGDCQW